MNEKYLNEALGGISTQNLDDALSYKKPHISFMTFAAVAAALVFVVGAGAFLYFNGGSNKIPTADVSADSAIDTGGGYSTGIGNISLDPTGVFTRTGTAYTAEQVNDLIDREKNIIAQYISSETKNLSGELRIATKGHNYAQAADNTIALDYLSLPVFTENNRIVGEVVLFTVDGKLQYSVMSGGPSWDRITEIISGHPDDKFAYVYVGQLNEVMISEDGTVYNMRSYGDDPLEGIKDKYGSYAEEENTFCLAECVKEKDYVSVKL